MRDNAGEKVGKPSMECRSDTYEGETAERVRLQCKVRQFQPDHWRLSSQSLPLKESRVSHSLSLDEDSPRGADGMQNASSWGCQSIMLPISGDLRGIF